MATFNETCTPTSTTYVHDQDIVISNLSNLLTYISKFAEFFLLLADLLVTAFKETHAPASRKYIAEQGIVISN